ncbi:uncharacterized protein LOC144292067 [Canis aureus]
MAIVAAAADMEPKQWRRESQGSSLSISSCPCASTYVRWQIPNVGVAINCEPLRAAGLSERARLAGPQRQEVSVIFRENPGRCPRHPAGEGRRPRPLGAPVRPRPRAALRPRGKVGPPEERRGLRFRGFGASGRASLLSAPLLVASPGSLGPLPASRGPPPPPPPSSGSGRAGLRVAGRRQGRAGESKAGMRAKPLEQPGVKVQERTLKSLSHQTGSIR